MNTLTQFLPLLKFLQTTLIVRSDLGSFTIEKSQIDEYEVIDMSNHTSTFMHIGLVDNIMLLNHDTDEETVLYDR
jgi:hypothetical protein